MLRMDSWPNKAQAHIDDHRALHWLHNDAPSVRAFGAVADDVSAASANATMLQTALDEGVPLYLPPGGWYVDGTLTLPANTMLYGAGRMVSRLVFVNAGVGLDWPGTEAGRAKLALRDFQIYTENRDATVGLRLINSILSVVERVRVLGRWNRAGVEIATDSDIGRRCSFGTRLIDCDVERTHGDSLLIGEGTGRTTLIGGHYGPNDVGWPIRCPTETGKVTVLTARDAIIEGGVLGQLYGDSLLASILDGCHVEGINANSPIVLGAAGACQAMSIRNCNIGAMLAPYCIDAGGGLSAGMRIVGNRLAPHEDGAGIRLKSAGGAVADNCLSPGIRLCDLVDGSSNVEIRDGRQVL